MSARRRGRKGAAVGFAIISLVFLYTAVANSIERPDGLQIASFFFGAIILTSLISRASAI
jgi:hypothetical protein